MHLTTRNVNSAFVELVRGIHIGTIPTVCTTSRNGDVLQIPEPVIITYQQPRERVLFNKARDCNPFFHLFEAIWMLSGSNLVEPVAFFAPNVRNYSDDGVTFNGAYGYRWRRSEDYSGVYRFENDKRIDQLTHLINHLQAKSDSRRAVLQMWNVEDDLLKVDSTKDNCCLSWDTKFRSPEGSINIQELANKFQNTKNFKFPVYTVDSQTGDQRLAWMTNAWKVGIKSVYTIKFDDGSHVRTTGDHIFYRKKKLFEGKRCIGIAVTETQACELNVGDRVLSALSESHTSRYTKSSTKNKTRYIRFKRNIFKNTSLTNMIREHQEYLRFVGISIPKSYSVHHIDGNGTNNKLSNLQILDNKTHFGIGMFGENNPHNRMTPSQKKERGRKLHNTWQQMPPEVRKAKGTYKKNRTAEQWKILEDYESSKSNHRIVSIENSGTTVVYDFTVPGRHNAVLDNGVLVHNCNLSVCFSLRQGLAEAEYSTKPYLDMTVFNRSNDLIWGALGANVVHFSYLQEYMANALGVQVGVYNQVSNNLHVYLNNWKPEQWLQETDHADCYPQLTELPLVRDRAAFDEECKKLVNWVNCGGLSAGVYCDITEPYLEDVVVTMLTAFRQHKDRNYYLAMETITLVQSPDWQRAGMEWLQRREASWQAKQGKEQ